MEGAAMQQSRAESDRCTTGSSWNTCVLTVLPARTESQISYYCMSDKHCIKSRWQQGICKMPQLEPPKTMLKDRADWNLRVRVATPSSFELTCSLQQLQRFEFEGL